MQRVKVLFLLKMENSIFNLLRKKISSNKIVISVVGMGYVGLPLALLFGKKFKTIPTMPMKLK